MSYDWMKPLDYLRFAGDVLDTPGSFVRTAASGRNPFPSIFDPEQRASGRDMLESWGVLGPNQEGLDAGDVAGFGAELLTDPLNLVGGGAIRKLGGFASRDAKLAAKAENAAILAENAARQEAGARLAKSYAETAEAMRTRGAMPPEAWKNTVARDESGNVLEMLHGTGSEGLSGMHDLDPAFAGSATDPGWFTKGVYVTSNEPYASQYRPTESKQLLDQLYSIYFAEHPGFASDYGLHKKYAHELPALGESIVNPDWLGLDSWRKAKPIFDDLNKLGSNYGEASSRLGGQVLRGKIDVRNPYVFNRPNQLGNGYSEFISDVASKYPEAASAIDLKATSPAISDAEYLRDLLHSKGHDSVHVTRAGSSAPDEWVLWNKNQLYSDKMIPPPPPLRMTAPPPLPLQAIPGRASTAIAAALASENALRSAHTRPQGKRVSEAIRRMMEAKREQPFLDDESD